MYAHFSLTQTAHSAPACTTPHHSWYTCLNLCHHTAISYQYFQKFEYQCRFESHGSVMLVPGRAVTRRHGRIARQIQSSRRNAGPHRCLLPISAPLFSILADPTAQVQTLHFRVSNQPRLECFFLLLGSTSQLHFELA